jgi:hypothetical protein
MTGWLNWQFAALALGIPVAVLTVLGWCCLVVASRADEAAERALVANDDSCFDVVMCRAECERAGEAAAKLAEIRSLVDGIYGYQYTVTLIREVLER